MLATIKRGVGRRLGHAVRLAVDGTVGAPPLSVMRDRAHARQVGRHQPAIPALSPAMESVRHDLETSGIGSCPLASLSVPGTGGMMAAAQASLNEALADLRARVLAGMPFVAVPGEAMLRRPEVFRFGLAEPLLDLAEAYLGLPAAYDGALIQYTPADGRAVSTRDWHRDREDRRMLKLCVYLNDVGKDDGPFELVSDAQFGARAGFHPTQADVAALDRDGAAPRITCCTGPAGTAVFADTARFLHRGRPATGRDRAAVFFSYFARTPQRPYYCQRSGLSVTQIAHLTADLSPRQRAAANWASALPLRWRLVPAAPV